MCPLRATALLAAAVLAAGCDRVDARFQAREGVDLYKRGDYAGAAARFDAAIRLDPTLPVLFLDSGTANLALFRSLGGKGEEGDAAAERAIRSYQTYLGRRPGDERVRSALVQAFIESGRYDDAVGHYRVAIDRGDVDELGVLATIATKCGRQDDAEAWHRRRVALAPERADVQLALGVFLWQELHDHTDWPHVARRSKAEQALAPLLRAAELQPASANGYSYASLVWRDLAETEPDAAGRRRALAEAARYQELALERQRGGG